MLKDQHLYGKTPAFVSFCFAQKKRQVQQSDIGRDFIKPERRINISLRVTRTNQKHLSVVK